MSVMSLWMKRRCASLPTAASPTLRRRELGALLRQLRQQAGLTVEEVAADMLCSPAKISRIETASRNISQRDVRDLGRIYRVSPDELAHLMELARAGGERGWWQQYDLPFATYVGLEAAASSLWDHVLGFVPALLETEEYARELISAMRPTIGLDQVEKRVESRLRRQERLREGTLKYSGIMDEAALHRLVGRPSTMAGQLEALLERMSWSNVSLRVIPFSAGPHGGLDSPFVILGFEDPAASDVVFVEGLVGFLYLERPSEIERYRQNFAAIQAAALDEKDSMGVVERAARSFL